MQEITSPPWLSCDGTRFLEKTASRGTGIQATVAGAMLADLGIYDRTPVLTHFENNLRSLRVLLVRNGLDSFFMDCVNHCTACKLNKSCAAGRINLAVAAGPAR